MTTVRPATDRDRSFLEETFLSALREAIVGARGFWDEVLERRQFQDQLQLQNTYIVSAADLNVGFYTASVEPNRLLLGTLCILPAYQSRGIGSQTMTKWIAEGSASRLPFTLFVLKSNPGARRFYERLGFTLAGDSERHLEMRRPPEGLVK